MELHVLRRLVTCVLAVASLAGCSSDPEDADAIDPDSLVCSDTSYAPGACVPGDVTEFASRGAARIDDAEPITYEDNPPSSGPHRGSWAKWGEYDYLPPERWIHNLEHGGVALLYNPCVGDSVIDDLREFARSQPLDPGGEFRWVLTPYPGLQSAVAVVAWGWVYEAECVQPDDITPFLIDRYRRAPEDVAPDGSFSEGWIGK